LGKAPNSSGNGVQANLNNPYAAALGGGMAGFGFQQEYYPQAQQGTGSFFRGSTPNPHTR